MGLFASIDSFFKDYASIIDNETNYTSGNIDVSKTTYLRRDSFFVENAVYYNQLRYELINKAFEVDETTFSKGITQIPVKDISIIKQEILINLKDLFLNSRDEIQYRYLDVLKFRVNIIETLISAITFATYAGDINKAISNLINNIDRVCKLSNSFDDELIELQNLLNSVLDAYEFLTSDRNQTYADYENYCKEYGNPINKISDTLSKISEVCTKIAYSSTTGELPNMEDSLDMESVLEKLYQNPYDEEYHLILKDFKNLENVIGKLSVPEEFFTGYRTYSDVLYLDLEVNEDILIANGDSETPILVNSIDDLRVNDTVLKGLETAGESASIFFRFNADIDISKNLAIFAKSGMFDVNTNTIGSGAASVYIDLNGKKLIIPNNIKFGAFDVDEDSESFSGTVNISNGDIVFSEASKLNAEGEYESNQTKNIVVRGGSSIENSSIIFEEDAELVNDLDLIGRRDVLDIDLSEGAVFKNSVITNATDYGMIFAGFNPCVNINQKRPNTTVENIHGNDVRTVHRKHIIFGFSFPVFWSSVGNVSRGAADAEDLCNNDLSISTGGENNTKILSVDNGNVIVNYSIVEKYIQLAKDTKISSLPLYYTRENGNYRVFRCVDKDLIDSDISLGQNGKDISQIQVNILASGGNLTTTGNIYFIYSDESILSRPGTFSSEPKDIERYFANEDGLNEILELSETASETKDAVDNALADFIGNTGSDKTYDEKNEAFNDLKEKLKDLIGNAIDTMETQIQVFTASRKEAIKDALDKYESSVDETSIAITCSTAIDKAREEIDPAYTKQFISELIESCDNMMTIMNNLYTQDASINAALQIAAQATGNTNLGLLTKQVRDVTDIKDALDVGVSIDQLNIGNTFLSKKADVVYRLQSEVDILHKNIEKVLTQTIDTHSEIIDIIDQFAVNMSINRDEFGFISALEYFIQADNNLINDESASYTSKFKDKGVRNYLDWVQDLQNITGNMPMYECAVMYVVSELGVMANRISPENIVSSKKDYHGQTIIQLLNRCLVLAARKGLFNGLISKSFDDALKIEKRLYQEKGLRINRYFMYENVDSVIQTLFPKIKEFNEYNINNIMRSVQKTLPDEDFNECKFIFTQQLLAASKNISLLNDLVASAITAFKAPRRTIRTRLLERPFYSALWDFYFVSSNSYLNDANINAFLTQLLSRKNEADNSKTIIIKTTITSNSAASEFLDYPEDPDDYSEYLKYLNENINNIKGVIEDIYKIRMQPSNNDSIDVLFTLYYSDYDMQKDLTDYMTVYNFYYDSSNSLATYLTTDLKLETIPFYKFIEGDLDLKSGVYRATDKLIQVTSSEMINDDDIYYYKRIYGDGSSRFLPLKIYKDDNAKSYKIPYSAGDNHSDYTDTNSNTNNYNFRNDRFLLDYFVQYRKNIIDSGDQLTNLNIPFLGARIESNETDSYGTKTENGYSSITYQGFKDLGYYAPQFTGDSDFPEQLDIQHFVACAKVSTINNVIFNMCSVDADATTLDGSVDADAITWNGNFSFKEDNILKYTFPIYTHDNLFVRGTYIYDKHAVREMIRCKVFIFDNSSPSVYFVFGCVKRSEGFIASYDGDLQPIWQYNIKTSDGRTLPIDPMEDVDDGDENAKMHDIITQDNAVVYESCEVYNSIQILKQVVNTSNGIIYRVEPRDRKLYDDLMSYFQIQGITNTLTSIEKYFVVKYTSILFRNRYLDKKVEFYYTGNETHSVSVELETTSTIPKLTINNTLGEYKSIISILGDALLEKATAEDANMINALNSVIMKPISDPDQGDEFYLKDVLMGEAFYNFLESNLQSYIDSHNYDLQQNMNKILSGEKALNVQEFSSDNNYMSFVNKTIFKPKLSPKLSAIMYKYCLSKIIDSNGNVDMFRKIPNIYSNGIGEISDNFHIYGAIYDSNIAKYTNTSSAIDISIFKLDNITKDAYENPIGNGNDYQNNTDNQKYYLNYYKENGYIYRTVFEAVDFSRYEKMIAYPDVGDSISNYCDAVKNLNISKGQANSFTDLGLYIAVDDRDGYDRGELMKNLGIYSIEDMLTVLSNVIIPEEYYSGIVNPIYETTANLSLTNIYDDIKNAIQGESILQTITIRNWFDKHNQIYYFVDQSKLSESGANSIIANSDSNWIRAKLKEVFGQDDTVIKLMNDKVLVIKNFGIFSSVPFMIINKNGSQTDVKRIGFRLNHKYLNLDEIYNMDFYTRKDYLKSGLDVIATLTNTKNIGYGLYNEYLGDFQTDDI